MEFPGTARSADRTSIHGNCTPSAAHQTSRRRAAYPDADRHRASQKRAHLCRVQPPKGLPAALPFAIGDDVPGCPEGLGTKIRTTFPSPLTDVQGNHSSVAFTSSSPVKCFQQSIVTDADEFRIIL